MQFEIPAPSTDFRGSARGRRADPHAPARQSRTACACWSRMATASPPTPIIRTGGTCYPNSTCWYSIFAIMGRTSRSSPRTTPTPSSAAISSGWCRSVKTRLGAKKTAGIFHSMSGRTAMKHAIEIGWRWDALMLFDPPDVPPPGHPQYAAMEVFENRLTEFARKRRRAFDSVEELVEEYKQSRATERWVAGEHELMAHSVLRKVGDGYELVCAPENEATIYAQALTLNLWPKAVRVRRAGQADRLRSEFQGRAGHRPGQPGARHRGRLRLQLRARHRPPVADREAGGVHRADAGVSPQARAGVATLSFRGARAASEPGIQTQTRGSHLDFGSDASRRPGMTAGPLSQDRAGVYARVRQ